MVNVIKRSVAGVILQSQAALPGVINHAAARGLTHVNSDSMNLNQLDLVDSRKTHDAAKVALRAERTALNTTKTSSRVFLTTARGFILPHLAGASNEVLSEAGFEDGSLAIPKTDAAVLQMMQRVQGYFIANPGHENAGLNITAARAGALAASLADGIAKVGAKKAALGAAKVTRDGRLVAVRNDLQTLLSELHVALDPTEYLWEEFGFKRPGILQMPEVPQNLTVVLTGPTAVSVTWDKATRARTYRVWKKVIGVDEDFVLVESINDLDCTIQGLPANATVEIAVSASNNGGESARSAIVSVTML